MRKKKIYIFILIITAMILSACGGADANQTPTLSVDQIQTLAIFTFQAALTKTAQALPPATWTPTKKPSPIATFAPPTDATTFATNTSSGGIAGCQDSAFVKDITIPDKTQMSPGQSFTKTWLMQNNGTCAWESGFLFNIIGGEAMGGVAVTLNQQVDPGRQIEISVPMVAPTDITGEVRGDWRLSDANGNYFGDSPYVIIVVGDATATVASPSTAESVTPSPTATETPTPTP